MSFIGEGEPASPIQIAFMPDGNQQRFVRFVSDAIARFIQTYAVSAKTWEVRANIEMTCGAKEFWTSHGRVRVESVVSERKCFELTEEA